MTYEKILGCLIGGAAGDAMGAATEIRTREQIKDFFGSYVTEFLTPPDDTFARGCSKAQITDDFSIAYLNCCAIAANGGVATEEVAKKALIDWFGVPEYSRFAGPTTRAAIERLMGLTAENKLAEKFEPAVDNAKGTNGAAMKAAPIALFSSGDVDRAIGDTVTMCRITHNNNVALSGACAVSAATAAALRESATLADVIEAGIYGAEQGNRMGIRLGKEICGPSIAKRIAKAVELAMTAGDMDCAMEAIGSHIGSGLMAAEAVPAVFGIVAASGGSAVRGIYGGVNIGDDTDTVATMVGGILGALEGAGGFPANYLEQLHRHNHIDLKKLADEIWALYHKN